MDAPKVTVRNFAYKLGLPKWDKTPTTTLCLNGNSNLEHNSPIYDVCQSQLAQVLALT